MEPQITNTMEIKKTWKIAKTIHVGKNLPGLKQKAWNIISNQHKKGKEAFLFFM